jgi:hypothetical protein
MPIIKDAIFKFFMQFNLNFAKIETKIKIYSNYGTGLNTFV